MYNILTRDCILLYMRAAKDAAACMSFCDIYLSLLFLFFIIPDYRSK